MNEGKNLKSPETRSRGAREYADTIAAALVNGKPASEIIAEMTRQGWKRDEAAAFVKTIDDARKLAEVKAMERPALRRGFMVHLVLGGLWVLAGASLMMTAKPERDLSSLGVAVIAFGIIEAVWAVRSWMRMR